MDLAHVGDRSEHVEVRTRHPRQTEQRQSLRQVEQLELGLDLLARRRQPLRGAGSADPAPESSPQLGLPAFGAILAGGPGAEHVGAVHPVVVEQVGDVVDHAEAVGGVVGPPACALEVLGQHRQPRLGEALVDDFEQWPHRALGPPRVPVGLDARGGRHRAEDQPAREREVDVRADAVRPSRRRPEPRRKSLREPPLDPARRDGDDLRREGVLERLQQRLGEAVGETVGTFGSMDVKHLQDPSSRLWGAPLGARPVWCGFGCVVSPSRAGFVAVDSRPAALIGGRPGKRRWG